MALIHLHSERVSLRKSEKKEGRTSGLSQRGVQKNAGRHPARDSWRQKRAISRVLFHPLTQTVYIHLFKLHDNMETQAGRLDGHKQLQREADRAHLERQLLINKKKQ